MRVHSILTAAAFVAMALLFAASPASPAATPGNGDRAPAAAVSPAPEAASGPAAAPRPGTPEETREYDRRQAETPEAQEFVGGHVGLFGLLVLTVLVLLVIYLAKEIVT
jgi:hypothetical protein